MLTVPKKLYLVLPYMWKMSALVKSGLIRSLHKRLPFVRLKLFSKPLIVWKIILVLNMLFLNLFVLANFIILHAETAKLHILVKPSDTRKSGSRNTKEYHLKLVNIWKELCQSLWEITCLIATTYLSGMALKYWGGSLIIGFWTLRRVHLLKKIETFVSVI